MQQEHKQLPQVKKSMTNEIVLMIVILKLVRIQDYTTEFFENTNLFLRTVSPQLV